jgi:hypothetical protein
MERNIAAQVVCTFTSVSYKSLDTPSTWFTPTILTIMEQSNFELFKLEIQRLYIQENKTLPCVMEYMTSKYSLAKS